MLTSIMTRSAIVVFLCALSFSAHAVADNTATHPINIAAQDLSTALEQLSRQSGTDLVYRPEQVKGLRTQGAVGEFTAEQAVTKLLVGTKLTVSEDPTGALLIAAPQATAGQSATPSTGGSAQPDQSTDRSSLQLAQATPATGPGVVAVSDDEEKRKKGEKKDVLQEVVVTGTHIHGVANTASPTQTITREEIDDSGYATTAQLVSTLPQNFNSITMAAPYGAGSTSTLPNQNGENATGIDLRGLGAQSTLTLVDGQRAAGAVLGRVVDVSLIPLSMVDHVDIATGGASAIYGADAVGGVANFVLRRAYNGADTQAYYGGTAKGGDRLQVSQTLGRDWGTSGFILGYEFGRDDHFNVVSAGLAVPVQGGIVPTDSWIMPDAKTNSVYLSGYSDIGDAVQFFADGSYVHKSQHQFSAANFPSFSFSDMSTSDQSSEEYGGAAGARIKISGDWQVRVTGALSAHENRLDEFSTDVEAGQSTNFPLGADDRSTLTSGSVVADGTLFSVGDIHVRSAFGIEGRREALSENLTPVQQFQDKIPSASRSVRSAFGELNIPFVEGRGHAGLRELTLSVSARDDHYSDFGNAFDPQAGLVWKPDDSLTVRGSIARAFRAPDLYALNQFTGTEIIDFFPVFTPSAPGPTNPPVVFAAGGNPNLGPERADTWTAGFDYQLPIRPKVRLSASYVDIDYKDRITTPLGTSSAIYSAYYPTSVLTLHPTPQQAAAFASLGLFEGNFSGSPWDGNPQTLLRQLPNLILFDDRNLNISTERYRGLDFGVDARVETAVGEASGAVNATKTFTHFQQLTPETAPQTIFNYVGMPAGFRSRGNVGFTHGAYSAFLFVNYTGGYANQFTTPQSRMPSWTTFDLTLKWDSGLLFRGGPLGGVVITVSAQNLFNRDPPLFLQNVSEGFLFDPANANPLRRVLGLNVVKKW